MNELSQERRKAIRAGTPNSWLGQLWKKNAIEVLDALEAAEERERALQAKIADAWDEGADAIALWTLFDKPGMPTNPYRQAAQAKP